MSALSGVLVLLFCSPGSASPTTDPTPRRLDLYSPSTNLRNLDIVYANIALPVEPKCFHVAL